MAIVLWGSGYQNAYPLTLIDGRSVSVAIKRDTNEVWFKAHARESLMVGTIDGKSAHIHELSNGHLVITDGISKAWRSTDVGRNWGPY